MHGGDRTDIGGMLCHPLELQLIVKPGDLGELVRQSIECLDDNHVEDSSSACTSIALYPGLLLLAPERARSSNTALTE